MPCSFPLGLPQSQAKINECSHCIIIITLGLYTLILYLLTHSFSRPLEIKLEKQMKLLCSCYIKSAACLLSLFFAFFCLFSPYSNIVCNQQQQQQQIKEERQQQKSIVVVVVAFNLLVSLKENRGIALKTFSSPEAYVKLTPENQQ